MKIKLDENLGMLGKSLLQADEHDVVTVSDQHLGGAEDLALYHACRDEGRVLVTLDHDFGETRLFQPDATPGIVVIKYNGRASPSIILSRLSELAALLRTRPIDHELWIVEPGRVRIREK